MEEKRKELERKIVAKANFSNRDSFEERVKEEEKNMRARCPGCVVEVKRNKKRSKAIILVYES